MSEDQEWSARALLDGWSILYEPRAAVRHSHVYTVRSAFRRFFDSGVSAERTYLAGARLVGARPSGAPHSATASARSSGSGGPVSAAGSRTRPSTRRRSSWACTSGLATGGSRSGSSGASAPTPSTGRAARVRSSPAVAVGSLEPLLQPIARARHPQEHRTCRAREATSRSTSAGRSMLSDDDGGVSRAGRAKPATTCETPGLASRASPSRPGSCTRGARSASRAVAV